jgi:hypothetical protein
LELDLLCILPLTDELKIILPGQQLIQLELELLCILSLTDELLFKEVSSLQSSSILNFQPTKKCWVPLTVGM